MVTVAVAGLHVEVRGGAAAEFAGGLDGLDLRGGGALGVEVALAGDFAGGGDDDAAEVGVGDVKPADLSARWAARRM